MKNYFKKFSIMFVMLLVVLGIGMIQNGNVTNAATVGQSLKTPEDNWYRYDSNYKVFNYNGTWTDFPSSAMYGGAIRLGYTAGNSMTFDFYGTKLRVIGFMDTTYANENNIIITIDGVTTKYTQYSTTSVSQALCFEKTGLTKSKHIVKISLDDNKKIGIDAIDVDKDGYLVQNSESITLNKSLMNLNVGDSQQLTATTTPDAVGVTWTSSDPTIATVDSNGNVTGGKEGQATITATINDGSNLSASCTVNVTNQIAPAITLNETSDSLVIGEIDNLVATTTPSGAQVIWTSSDENVAIVDSNGKITGVNEGTCTITATTVDGLTATCAVTVTPKTTEPTNPDPTDSEDIVNIAHAKGDNTNNAGGDVTIIFHGAADTTLSVVKTADVKEVWVGDNFTYTIVVTNTGTKTAKAVVVNDPAPNHIDFVVNGITTTQGTVDSSSTSKNVIVNVGDIAPGATVIIKVPATVIL